MQSYALWHSKALPLPFTWIFCVMYGAPSPQSSWNQVSVGTIVIKQLLQVRQLNVVINNALTVQHVFILHVLAQNHPQWLLLILSVALPTVYYLFLMPQRNRSFVLKMLHHCNWTTTKIVILYWRRLYLLQLFRWGIFQVNPHKILIKLQPANIKFYLLVNYLYVMCVSAFNKRQFITQ